MRRDVVMAGGTRLLPAVPAAAGGLLWGLEAFSAWMSSREGKAELPYLETGFSVAEWTGAQALAGGMVAMLLLSGAVLIGRHDAMGHMLVVAGCCLALGMHLFGWWFLRDNADRLDGRPFAVIFYPVLALFPILTIALTWFCLPGGPRGEPAAPRLRSKGGQAP